MAPTLGSTIRHPGLNPRNTGRWVEAQPVVTDLKGRRIPPPPRIDTKPTFHSYGPGSSKAIKAKPSSSNPANLESSPNRRPRRRRGGGGGTRG